MPSNEDVEKTLFNAIKTKDKNKLVQTIDDNPGVNLNCKDKDDFTPLQNACHLGHVVMVSILLDRGADINLSARKDGYTPLMLASIGNKSDVVGLLLERGVNKTSLNCVNRTAAEMAAFVGLSHISARINCWVPFSDTVKPFTKCLELEDEPRISSELLACQLHKWIVYPTLQPVRLLLFLKHNTELIKQSEQCIFVLERLSSKYIRQPLNDESLSLKFHYYAELLRYCKSAYEQSDKYKETKTFEEQEFGDFLLNYLRRLTAQTESKSVRPRLNDLILKSIYSYPYNSSTYQSVKFACSKLKMIEFNAMSIITQTIDIWGPRHFGKPEQACEVCDEGGLNKKCATCKSIYYCGPDCQKIDWIRHKRVCKSS